MISCEGFAAKHVVVLGLGKSGLAAARALCRSGARVLTWDDAQDRRDAAQAEGMRTRDPERVNWASVDALVISPGIPHSYPEPHIAARLAKHAGVPIIGDVELLAASGASAHMVAITGTNGKSTTTALLAHIVEQAGRDFEVGGNLGPPIGEMAMMENDGLYVLELSSYQLELCPSARFKVAVLLNISPDHLDRHGDMDGYVHAKKNIFRNQRAGDTAIIGVDTPEMAAIFTEQKLRNGRTVLPIASETTAPGGVYVVDRKLIDDLDGKAREVMSLGNLVNLPGIHNAQNIAAAYAAARMLGLDIEHIVEAISTFPGLEHRQEIIEYFGGVTFVNDSKATNAEATGKALVCYDNVYWIVGGRAKETGLQGLDAQYPHVRRAFLIGEAAQDFATQLDGKVTYDMCGDLHSATRAAFAAAVADGLPGAVVLLSPACASFDQFANFEERGDAFRACVDTLRSEQSGGHMHPPQTASGANS